MTGSLVVLYLYLFLVGQTKVRDAAGPAVGPQNKQLDSGDSNAQKQNDKSDPNSGDQKKNQTEEKPTHAAEAKKVEQNEFNVRVVCVYVSVIYSWKRFLNSFCF